MLIKETDEKRMETIRRIKRKCLLCTARKGLDPRERERKSVLSELNELKNEYNELYNEHRRENKSAEEIQQALENKRACMDALDICEQCPKDFERVNRFLSGY